jgi:hypothetical protein
LPFASTSVVLGGAIPMPSLLQPMLSLALASPVLVKPASRDPVTARLLADSIAEVDEELGRAIEVVSFPPDDAAGLDRFLGSECVVASGADATIAAIGARLHGGQRFVAYGHRLSIAVLDGDSVQVDPDGLAAAVARDVALWDQLGCLSPVAIYVVGPDAPACAQRFAEALARALDALARTLPRGPVAADVAAAIVQERDGAAMRAAGGDSVHVHSGHGTSWTVVAEHDAAWRAGPLHRFVRVHPVPDVPDLARAVRPIARHLSSVGLAAGPSAIPDLEAALWRFGATRICPPGHMQAPPVDWPHDGRPILAPLARIGVREAARPG